MNVAFFANLAITGLVEGLMIALAALSLTLVFAVARFPNAATGDVMTLGAYAAVAAQVATGSIWAGGAVGIVAAALVAWLFYLLVFARLEGRSLVAKLVASIGIAFLIRSLLTLFVGHDQRIIQLPIVRAMRFGEIRVLPTDLWLAGAALATLLVAFAVLYLTPAGRRMRAVADDPDLARASGIAPARVMLALWLLAGAVAGLAGIVLGIKTVVAPEMGWEMLLPAFAAAILGGIGNPIGAVLAGVLLGVAQELSTPFVGFSYKIGLSFVVLLVVLLLRPQGILGSAQAVR